MSRLLELLEDTNDIGNIKNVQFSILSPDNIRKGSVVEIIHPDTYDGNVPKIGGLFDPRMGVLDGLCATCENRAEICPGHFGHIELAMPVFNLQYIDTIIKILRCICFRCSNLLINKEDPYLLEEIKKKSGKAKFNIIYAKSMKLKKCIYNNGCNVLQPIKYVKNRPDKNSHEKTLIFQIIAEFPSEAIKDPKIMSNKQTITPQICLDILKKITDENCEFLGFSNKLSRPDWMIFTVLPVPPPSVRPSIRQDNNQRSEDDLTYSLVNIVKNNKILKQKIESNSAKNFIESYHGALQYYIATFIDNEIPGVPPCAHRSGRPLKSITQRLTGKEGRLRGNIMGKRVDYSARSVITVDTNISIDEFGVPIEIAMNLTYPEVVTKYNINDMYQLIRNGPNKYPGAKSIRKMEYNLNGVISPCTLTLKYIDINSIVLNEGDIINRHLQDGDVCIFNRQPSLHRMSMMAMKVKVLPGKTFKLNVFVCKSFNADFDGDEMNAHAPQSITTSNEIRELTRVSTQIISPAQCKPIIYVVQDTLTAAFLLTQDNTNLSSELLDNIMMNVKNYLGLNTKLNVSGREAYSMLLPPLSIMSKDNNENKFLIENGEFKCGSLDTSSLQGKGLIQDILNMFSISRCHEFLDDTQRMITRWYASHGFSVGLGDAVPPKEFDQQKIDKYVDEKMYEINEVIAKAHHGIYEQNLDNDMRRKSLEAEIMKIQTDIENNVVKNIKSLISKDNRFYTMIAAGTKGDYRKNLKQIMGLLGQQDVWGKRVSYGFTYRTLPHFQKYDFGSKSRGFIRNSFVKGLQPEEFFFHLMSGRVGLIDTAVKTAESGYISRRLVKAMEDIKIVYDGTVRNNANNIVQLLYGDDSYDPIKLEKITDIELAKFDNLTMIEKFKFDHEQDWKLITRSSMIPEQSILDKEYEKIMNYREKIRYEWFKNMKIMNVTTYMPFNLYRFIKSVKYKFNISDKNVSDLDAVYIINNVNELCNYVTKYLHEDGQNELTKSIICNHLASKRVIIEYKFNKDSFDYIINDLKNKIIGAFVQPGEMVGPVSAQSLGEVSTQLTLNSVEYNERIIIKENGLTRSVKFGEFIDNIVNKTDKNSNLLENHPNNTILRWTKLEDYKVISLNENGEISWKKIEAVTRHPVVNEDGSDTLIKVLTKSGRTVTATKAKSFLTRQNGKIIAINGSDLKIGDRLPISLKYPIENDLIDELNIDEYCNISDENRNCIIDKLLLDECSGFFFGSYLSNGSITKSYIKIMNNNDKYRKNIIDFCNKYKIRIDISNNIKIYSTLLRNFVQKSCYSMNMKKIPDFIYSANNNFVKGLLNAYFSDSGKISMKKSSIKCYSMSEELHDGIINLLSRFNIFTKKSKIDKKMQKFVIKISYKNINHFYENIELILDSKQKKLKKLNEQKYVYQYSKNDIIPGIGENNQKIHRNIYKLKNDKSIDDIYFDEIIKIEEVYSKYPYVYDLTIEETRTFVLQNMLAQNDTFHSSGQSGGSIVTTLGVPRMKEIINLSKNIKTPSMKIYLNDEFAYDRIKAETIKNKIEYTKLRNIVLHTEILYENSSIEHKLSTEDHEFINIYNEFNNIICVDNQQELSNWILRIVFDKELMLSKNILMTDVQEAILLNSQNDDDIQCIISDDNSSEMVMRIKVKTDIDIEDEYFVSFLKDLEKHILDMTLRGIKNIIETNLKEDNIVKYNPDGSYINKKEWIIETNGTNMNDLLIIDNIDIYRSESNDILEIFEIFGIEAVRNKIISELGSVFKENDINQRHIALLADFMTYRGVLTQIDRHGMNRIPDSGVIAKATFEEVSDMFIKASTFAEVDKMTGVSSNIMFGQIVPAGTNMMDILFDENKMINYGLEIEDQQIYNEDNMDYNTIENNIENEYENYDETLDITDNDFNFGYQNITEYNIGPVKIKEDEKIIIPNIEKKNKKITFSIKKKSII